jgi:uncharacterized OsmC-like protein
MMAMEDLKFQANLVWDGESGGEVSVGKFQGLKLDMPVEFGGNGRYPCPDELFLSAVAGCLLTTFLYFKKKMNVHVTGFRISISATLHGGREGYRLAGMEATIFAEAKKSNELGLRRCIELARRYCHLTRTLEKAVPIRILDRIMLVD